jgi:hypothetical protein
MTHRYSTALRNNQVAQIQTTVGSTGTLKIFSGAEPANCAAADPSGLLVTITLPATFLTSTGGVTTLAGTWGANATGTGTAVCYRIYDATGTACQVQGTAAGAGSDLVLNNASIAVGQAVSVTSYAVTAGNS